MYPKRPVTGVGTYLQGSIATLLVTTIRAKREPAGFVNMQVRIETQDFSSIVLPNTAMARAPEGYYFYDWEVPAGLTPGLYQATFSSDLQDQTFEKTQMITVISSVGVVNQNLLNSNAESELLVGLYYLIKETQEIPVEYEQAKISSNGLVANFTFNKWNVFNSKTAIYRNGEIITSGFTIDYDLGQVTFLSALTEFDTINADYNFSWFDGDELTFYLFLSLQDLNNTPPGSNKSLGSAPDLYYPAILYGAAVNIYRRLIHDLSYQEPRLVYGMDGAGAGGFKDATDNFRYLKENYEKSWEDSKKNAKRNIWPAIGVIVAPEFTMPGGRSRWFRYLFKG
jgi:hypothetical protein